MKTCSNRLPFACLLTLALSLAAIPMAKADNLKPDSSEAITADQERQMLDRDLAFFLAPIKSKSDLQKLLLAKGAETGPLATLSPLARERFIESLTFNEKGVTGFRFDDLEAELTPSQIYKLLALFGQQHIAATLRGARVASELDAAILNLHDGNSAKCVIIQRGGKLGTEKCFPAVDHSGYWCESRATCASMAGRICTSNC